MDDDLKNNEDVGRYNVDVNLLNCCEHSTIKLVQFVALLRVFPDRPRNSRLPTGTNTSSRREMTYYTDWDCKGKVRRIIWFGTSFFVAFMHGYPFNSAFLFYKIQRYEFQT